MSVIDVEKIINGTPQKVLINAYEKMKENFNKDTAMEFMESYKDQPLSFIIENSELIFTEPYFGIDFYEATICDVNSCTFLSLESELEKVTNYIEAHNDMPESQKKLYVSLKDSINTILEHTKNTRIYANYIKENYSETFESELADAIYSYRKTSNGAEKITSLFESASLNVYLTYAPYVNRVLNDNDFITSRTDITESLDINQDVDAEKWKSFVETVLCVDKLLKDSYYKESVKSIDNKEYRDYFLFAGNIDLEKVMESYTTVTVNPDDVVSLESVNAVNCLFDDIYENQLFNEFGNDKKDKNDLFKSIILESSLDIILSEYQTCSELSNESSYYPFVESGSSIESAYDYLVREYSELNPDYVSEATDENGDEDVSDDEIDNIDNDEEIKPDNTGKKIKAPKPKNLATKVQNKYMDKEARQFQKRAIRKQQGQEIGNAAKAVVALPTNVVKDIKEQIHKLDEKDDERRKNFMTEPGFRKKAFRNLKLAILYGSAATVKLSLLPIVMICRHFSKQKDARIRNELVRELDTQIAVTEEKINDASAEGDKKEKYRLMRIRDQLKAEMVRVRMNSKYV